MTRSRPGYTLVEILVACGLLLLALTVLAQALVPSLRVWMHSRTDSEAQQAAAVLMARIREEIRCADPGSIACVTDPGPALLFLSWKRDDGSAQFSEQGDFLWQKRMVFYRTESGEVRLQENPVVPPSAEVEPRRVATFTAEAGDRLLARGVKRMDLVHEPTTGVVYLTLQAGDEDRTSEIRTSAAPVLKPEPSPSPAGN